MTRNLVWTVIASLISLSTWGQGIDFEHKLTWEQLLQKAKQEDKYVFVDCYASWCGPCKSMDKSVYPVDSVGAFMNDQFISVKMQMDTSQHDSVEIKSYYATAHSFQRDYGISLYPSYLFFSPDGKVVHKDIGGRNCKEFLDMARAAMDSNQQFYTLLSAYHAGNIKFNLLPVLADAARRQEESKITIEVTRYYLQHYLSKLPKKELWTSENIGFINRYSEVINVRDSIFQIYYRDRKIIDSVMHDVEFADNLINVILFIDEIKPSIDSALLTTIEPDWHHLENTIAKSYGVFYGAKNVLDGRVEYYEKSKKWDKYVKYLIAQKERDGIEIDKPSLGRSYDLNNTAFEIFKYSRNKKELKKALKWINDAIAMDDKFRSVHLKAEEIDTKANLLYKLGKKPQGLALEQKSLELVPKAKDITQNYEKMKKGQPTWVTE